MRRRIVSFLFIATSCCSAAWNEHTYDSTPKLAKELTTVDPGADVDVIVQYKTPPREEHFNRVHFLGGVDKRRFKRIPGAAFTVPASSLQDLAKDPDVAYISMDRKVHSHLDLSAAAINAAVAWGSNYTGTGIGVAVIDSGINSQVQDLGNASGQTDPAHSRVIFAENFLVAATGADGKPSNARYQTNDGYGHGTHVAGIIAGNGFLSSSSNAITTYKGIAPTANLIDFQVLDANGEGQDSTVIAAIEEAINLKSKYNIRVINLSLGRSVYESFALDPLCQAVEQAWKAGIVVVVAAGNDGRDNSVGNGGYGTINAPGNDPYALTVGAMNAELTPFAGDDVITTYSSRGPTMVDHIVKPDIMAPGNHISSLLDNNGTLARTYPQNIVNPLVYQTNGGGQSYLILNGTSMATGVVSGAAADLLSANPSLTPDQVKSVLMLSANKQFRTYSSAYYSQAALSYGQNAQLQQAQQQLQAAQGQVKPTSDQQTNAQQQAAQQATAAQAASAAYGATVQQANTEASQVTAAQAQFNAATTAYQTANQQQNAANQTFAAAQATLQSAQQLPISSQKQTAVNQAQANFNAAQATLQSATNAAHAAQDALNKAEGELNQAQNGLNDANHQVQNALNAMNQANAMASTAAQTAAKAQAAAQSAAQNVANLKNLVSSLQVPSATLQSQLQQMQADATQYTDTQYDVFTVGAGYLDLKAALANIQNAPISGSALSPVAYVDPTSGQVYASADYAGLCGNGTSTAGAPLAGSAACSSSVASSYSIWRFDSDAPPIPTISGTKCIWGAQSVWGANSFTSSSSGLEGTKCIWGAQSIWGASATEAFKCIWGAQSVWGANASGATSTDSASSVIGLGDQ